MTKLEHEMRELYVKEMRKHFHHMKDEQAIGYLNGSGWDLDDAIRTAK